MRLKLADRPVTGLVSAEILTGPGPKAANSFEQPDLLRARPFQAVDVSAGEASFALPPLSLAALTFQVSR